MPDFSRANTVSIHRIDTMTLSERSQTLVRLSKSGAKLRHFTITTKFADDFFTIFPIFLRFCILSVQFPSFSEGSHRPTDERLGQHDLPNLAALATDEILHCDRLVSDEMAQRFMDAADLLVERVVERIAQTGEAGACL